MEIEGSHEIREKEWSCFLAHCWERGEAPSNEAWKKHLRRAAFVSLRRAHKLLSHAATDNYFEELIEAEEETSDEIIALVNAHMRIWPCPHLPAETWEAYLSGGGRSQAISSSSATTVMSPFT